MSLGVLVFGKDLTTPHITSAAQRPSAKTFDPAGKEGSAPSSQLSLALGLALD